MNDLNTETAESREGLSRIALCVSYNGARYHGWQEQKSGVASVESVLRSAIERVANHSVELTCAGRTDKGVHASHQFVHFDSSAVRSPRSWVFGCNSALPKDVSVLWADQVADDFHARYSATSRRYFYCIYNHPVRPSNYAKEVTWCHYPLDASRMHAAAQCLVGEHDFSSFRAAGCQSRSPMRFLEHVDVFRMGHMIVMDIKGNAFLHHMVRNIAGVLMSIGSGEKDESWCAEVLAAKDRTAAGVTAPAGGLYLAQVDYPEGFGLPTDCAAPAFLHSLLVASGRIEFNDSTLWDLAFLK